MAGAGSPAFIRAGGKLIVHQCKWVHGLYRDACKRPIYIRRPGWPGLFCIRYASISSHRHSLFSLEPTDQIKLIAHRNGQSEEKWQQMAAAKQTKKITTI